MRSSEWKLEGESSVSTVVITASDSSSPLSPIPSGLLFSLSPYFSLQIGKFPRKLLFLKVFKKFGAGSKKKKKFFVSVFSFFLLSCAAFSFCRHEYMLLS